RTSADLIVTINELNKLQEAGGEEDLVKRLSEDNGTLSRHLFDSETPPAEVQQFIDVYRRKEPLSQRADEIYSVLDERLEKQADTLETRRQALYREYLTGFHEQEAWVIGQSLDARARQYEIVPPKSTESTVYGASLPRTASDAPGIDSGFAHIRLS